MFSIYRFLAVVVAVSLGSFAVCSGRAPGAQEAGSTKFGTPEAVYAAYKRAQNEDDDAQLYRCLSDDHRLYLLSDLVFPAYPRRWERPLTDQFVDREALRRKVREVLPVNGAEAMPIVREVVKDPEAAFLASIKDKRIRGEQAEQEKERERKENGEAPRPPYVEPKWELTDVKIDGDRAEGILRDPNKVLEKKLELNEDQLPREHFVREDGEWKIDLHPATREAMFPADRSEPKYQGWKELPPPCCETPTAANAYLVRAENERNPAAAWQIMSQRAKRNIMKNFFRSFWTGGGKSNWATPLHVELTRLERGMMEGDDFFRIVRDEEAYFCSLVKWNWQLLANQREGKPLAEELKNVVIDGDRARGEVTRLRVAKALVFREGGKSEEVWRDETKSTEARYFTRNENGWILDAPTVEESKRDFAEWEKAFEQRKAERKAKEEQKENN